MTIHRLTAGSGYDYLTRQVARQDATEVGHRGLGSYYTAKGEAPGVWVGAGMAGIAGLAAGLAPNHRNSSSTACYKGSHVRLDAGLAPNHRNSSCTAY